MTDLRQNDLTALINTLVEDQEETLIAIRRDLHAHPELGFETHRTAGIVADKLRSIGLIVQTGVGRTGVVAEVVGGQPGPVLILRADMDALPIEERTGLPFASTVPGQMHACGHDVHTSALLGVAGVLAKLTPRLSGTVRLVFQPAEEIQESGAAAMLADGVGEGADMAVTYHNVPDIPNGQIFLVRGTCTASSDEFRVTLTGRSGHAARPHHAADPIVGAAYIITQLQTIVARRMNPSDPMVLTIGQIAGGFTENIIPDSCSFSGTVRCRSAATRDMAESALRGICVEGARSMGLSAEVNYVRGVPALVNDDRLVDIAGPSLEAQFEVPPMSVTGKEFGAEDFAYFTERMPGLQLHVGSGQPGRDDRLHNSDYQPDEGSIGIAARALSRLAFDLLATDPTRSRE